MENLKSTSNELEDEGLNIREELENYIIHWKWIAFSIIVFLTLAFLYLRYTIPIYSAATTIMVRDDKKGGIQSELSAFTDLRIANGAKGTVENETEVFKSRTLISKTVKDLGLNIKYFTEGHFKTYELYDDCPIKCNFIAVNSEFYELYKTYNVNLLGGNKFEIFNDSNTLIGTYSYGELISIDGNKLIVNKTERFVNSDINNYKIKVSISRLLDVVMSFKGGLSIAPLGKNTSLLELTINDPIKERAEDFLNDLVAIYNSETIEDKNFISKKTEDFIENRIRLIAEELGDVEKGEEGFKRSNKITDLTLESQLFLSNSSELEKKIIENGTEISIINTLSSYIKSNKTDDLLPGNVVISDPVAVAQITSYNNLILDRNRIIKEGSIKSPVLINADQKIAELKQTIQESLARSKANLNVKNNDLERQLRIVEGKISTIPTNSRLLRGIERQQQIKQNLYLYLLQKREETAISLAVTAPNAKVIDAALASGTPISPKSNMIYLIGLLFGLAIPLGIIYISQLLDTKIKSRVDIEKNLTVPYIGDVPRSKEGKNITNTNNRSSSVEAMRIVRTNLEFLLGNVPENQAKTIFVTSTVPKEGKTFVAINLASTIALSGKKTLVIGLDIRNPQLGKYVDSPQIGITNFLSKPHENIQDYLFKIPEFENFYVLPAGTIPPNPAELLMSDKLKTVFDELKKEFDYIIVDTAPITLVTDTLLIAKNADAFVYVARANYLEKRMLKIPENYYRDKKLPNMAMLLNDTVWKKRYGYGYTYGYSYGYGSQKEKKSFLKKWFDKIFKS